MSESPNPTLQRAYRVRLSPTPLQARTLRRLFGARRFVWNWALQLDRTLRAAGERSGVTAWSAAFTALKREPATAWLTELPREPFSQTLRDLERAKKNFFAGRARPPRRKRFGTVDSARFTLDQRRQQVTLGERHGEVQIADARPDHLHTISAAAVRRAEITILEDLAIAPMGRALHVGFRRGVVDAGLGELGRQLTYKAQWHGRVVVRVDRWFPSSKTCSGCDHVYVGLRLKDSRWTCPACGADHHRDLNAAINLEREGLRLLAERRTPRSGGTDAQGESACATSNAPPVGQPNSTNCELSYRAAARRPRAVVRDGPRTKAREG